LIFRFFLLAYGITWGALVPFLFLSPSELRAFPSLALLVLVAKFGPSLAGLAAAAAEEGERGVLDLMGRLVPRARDVGWLALAVLAPVAVAAGTTRALVAGGTPPGPIQEPGLIATVALLAWKFFLGGGLGEELGWRGFALPRLQRVLPPVAATLVLGMAWALWHWPAFRMQGAERPGDTFPVFLVTVAALAVVFTWLYNRTGGNLLACALLHASVNATGEVMERTIPLLWTNGMADGTLAWFWGGIALLLIGATRGRLAYRGEAAAR